MEEKFGWVDDQLEKESAQKEEQKSLAEWVGWEGGSVEREAGQASGRDLRVVFSPPLPFALQRPHHQQPIFVAAAAALQPKNRSCCCVSAASLCLSPGRRESRAVGLLLQLLLLLPPPPPSFHTPCGCRRTENPAAAAATSSHPVCPIPPPTLFFFFLNPDRLQPSGSLPSSSRLDSRARRRFDPASPLLVADRSSVSIVH